MNNNLLKRFMVLLLVWLMVGGMLYGGNVSTPRGEAPTLRNYFIAQTVIDGLCTYHYNSTQITPQLMSRWFDAYFDMLDPERIYFLKEDVESFRGMEGELWDAENKHVNLEFALKVYEVYLRRLQEWESSYSRLLDAKHDFSVREYMPVNLEPSEIAWCTGKAELHERWRLRVKNILLGDMLNQEERSRIAAEEKKEEGGAVQADTVRRKDIRERTRKRIENFLKLRREADQEEVMSMLVNSFASLLDPHTNYLPPAEKENFDISTSLSLQGIGATLQTRDSYTTVVDLIPGGPAARDGRLRPGDRIVAVAQSAKEEPEDVVDMALDKVVQRIRGPKGTEVFLTVMPDGAASEYVIRLVRDEVQIKDAEARGIIRELRAGNGEPRRILQIYLPSFYRDFEAYMRRKSNFKSCTRDVANIIRNARVRGKIDGIILDMRGNGGGSLDEAVQLCGLFLQGRFPVVQQQGADRVNHLLYSENKAALYSGPLMVMVDHLSASAAEIAAACLQDCGRAVIVGSNTTFGKGTIQTLVDVDVPGVKGNAGAYKLTMGKFYRINGGATQEKGVIPDIIFPTFAEYMGYSEAKMPNVLPWDSTTPARYGVDATMEPRIAKLKKLADVYMKQNANFLEYAGEVEKYRRLRERKQVPLEIGERREYREHEMRAIRQMRRYEPDRKSDDRPTLKGENDDLYEDKNAEKRDVILDTALQLMFNFVDISEKTGK